MCEKPTVAVFDFDGTLIRKDSFLEFIKFAFGKRAFLTGFFLNSPYLVAFKLKLYPNWKAKERVFSYFFRGMSYEQFCRLGQDFAAALPAMQKSRQVDALRSHKLAGHRVYVVSASVEEWVAPWCLNLGVDKVLATKVEVKEGRLTGRLLSKNCYGQEKVNRLLEVEPERNSYILHAYGDSRGDKEMLAFADFPVWCK
jgi:phosphatidylglycerophosphatase C